MLKLFQKRCFYDVWQKFTDDGVTIQLGFRIKTACDYQHFSYLLNVRSLNSRGVFLWSFPSITTLV